MKKSTKGVIAAGAAAVLLLGGLGSLAFWNAEQSIDAGAIESGSLALTEPTGAWTLNGVAVPEDGLEDIVLVPSDELVFDGSYVVEAVGDNLTATVDVETDDAAGALAEFVTTTSSFTLEGVAIDEDTAITDDNDGDVIDVDLSIVFPFGTEVDNLSQGRTLDLSAITVTLTQTDATP